MKQPRKQGFIRTVLELTIITLLILSAFNIINSIYINPGDAITYQLDSPLESYVWGNPYNVSRIIMESTFIVFNNTGFNITSSNPISIQIDHIDEDIFNPADTSDELLSYTVTETGGNTWFRTSGFEPTLTYTIKKNGVFFSNEIANSTGSLSFYDNPSINDQYIYYQTAGGNNPPTITNPSPGNASTGISLSPTLQADIADADGNPMTYYIRTNESGNWYTIKTDSGVYDSTISNASTGNFTTNYTKYWWSVNLSDGTVWVNNTFHFTTTGGGTPVVQTNAVTNLQEINVTLNGLLLNDGGEDAWSRFQWGNTSDPLAHTTINQTRNSGESFTVSVQGNIADWYNSDWIYRKEITINHEFIDNTLTYFPVFINDTDSDYQYAQDSLGYDFVFTASDGTTVLNYEVVRFNYGLRNLEAWVNVTSLSSSVDTTIYLYWGNLTATNQENLSGTWSNGYVGVYHLDEQVGSDCYDSSGNSNDATYYGGLPNRVVGESGFGQNFVEGSGSYISFPEGCQFNNTEGGVVMYILPTTITTTPEYFFTQYNSSTVHINIYHSASVNAVAHQAANGTLTWSGSYNGRYVSSDWTSQGTQWNETIANPLYNQIFNELPISLGLPYGGYNIIRVGTYWDDSFPYDGLIDEIRFWNVQRNSSWTGAEYYTTHETDEFITYWDSESEYSDTGNVTAGTLYFYRAVANNTNGTGYGSNVTFLTLPYEPELLAALMSNKTAIQLTWVQVDGSGHNTTYIERGTSSTPWVRGSGTEVYNDTLLIYNDTGLDWGTTYYYQAWSYANWSQVSISYYQYSNNFDSAFNTTNSLPVFSNPIPINNSESDVGVDISITIEDPDGDTFNWSISTFPNISYNSANGASNGTKTSVASPLHNTNYIWYVNCTDGYDWINRTYNFTAMITYVAVPVGGASEYVTSLNRLNLTWTNHSGANETYRTDTYVVIQRNDTYATSATQSGNWVRANRSLAYFNISWPDTSGGYFSIFGWNETVRFFSYNNATPSGLNIPWGALAMQCYDEITHEALIFDILITNSALETYSATDLSNIHYLDLNDIPFGTNTIFYISNGTHESRTYYYDIFVNNFYNLTFYLPLALPPGGVDDPTYDPDNETYSTLYLITVIDERGETVQDVRMQIMRYFNETDTYENVTILRSDANGQADVYLFSGAVYKVNLSKDGYITRTDDWVPSDSIFTKTFKIYFEETEPSPPDVEPENIIFTGEISGTILYVNYTDNMNGTVNTTVYVYEIELSTGLETLFGSYNTTDTDSFQTTFININSSNTYKIILFYTHDTFGDQTKTLILDGTYTPLTTPEEINNLLTIIIGTNPYGWANFLIWLFLVAGFYYADPKDSGKILILLGGMFLFLNLFVGFNTTLMSVAGGAIPILFIVAGILMMWNESHKKQVNV